jgi:two-component system, NarL family, sensor histidine kinase BarA
MIDHKNPIDWHDVMRITNNKPELAKEMLSMFGAELPEMKVTIKAAFQSKNYADLLKNVHKLHGSCCYCGVAKLKKMTADLEIDLKQQQYQQLPKQITELIQQMDLILEHINSESMAT